MAKGNRWADPLPEAPQPQPPAEAEKPQALTDDNLTELLGFAL